MAYTIQTNIAAWRIEPDHHNRWFLKRYSRHGWVPVEWFESAEKAAKFVAKGKTGETDWDSTSRRARDFALDQWEVVEP